MNLMLVFIGFVVLLRLFERAVNKTVTPFDPFDGITDGRVPMDRTRDRNNPPPKDLTGGNYDAVAIEQLRRTHERRRRAVPDNGMRRRKDDKR